MVYSDNKGSDTGVYSYFFLVISLSLLNRRLKLALLMFSISLGIKHIAIFCLPLYLIYLWKTKNQGDKTKSVFNGLLIICSIPFLTSVPFLFWNAEGFLKSVLFSATRLGDLHINAPSIDLVISKKLTWFIGLKAKILMLTIMGLTYLSFLKEKVGVFISCTLVMITFVYFNSVLYMQYIVWYVCLMPFALVELIPLRVVQRQQQKQKKVLLYQ